MQIRPPLQPRRGVERKRPTFSCAKAEEKTIERERGGRPGPSLPGGLAGGPGRAGEGRGIALRNVLPPAPQVVWLLLSHTLTFKRRNEFAERFKCRVRKTLGIQMQSEELCMTAW